MFLPGAIAMWVAFFALVASTFFYFRTVRGHEEARAWARQLYGLATVAILIAGGVLVYLILAHDFRVHYVYSYSDLSLPKPYLIATLWAGQEGSFLLWLMWGMVVGLPLIRYARHYEERTMVVYNVAQLSLVLILLKQSPFRFISDLSSGQVPLDGQGLNPLLQNPWMTIHPPIMFLGYAATAVPFALAVAALWGRRYDEWTKAALPWGLVTVVTLGCAILLGGYWAYVTLGWGGYWGWDPVENASLVPWIASAALVHGMILQRARGRFRKLNFSLAILAYVLVVYGTFLTRSGVLADFSVHSFVDLGITGWLVANLAGALVIGFGALAWRWREIPTQQGDEPFLSRTVFFVLAIAALLGTAAMVLFGTSTPLITRLATKPSQVGPAFYNRVVLPIGIVLAALLGTVPFLQWKGAAKDFRNRLLLSGGLAAVATGVGIVAGARGVLYVTFLLLAIFAFFSNLLKTWDEARQGKIRSAGGYLAHVGLGLMLAGIVISSAYDRSQKVVLPLGQSRQVMGYTLTFKGVDKPTPTARDAMLVEVQEKGGRTYVARPHLFRNEKSNQLVANPDVHMQLTHDVYVSPIEFDPGRPPENGDALDLGKGETGKVGPLAVTFDGFDMSAAHGEDPQKVAIGAHLTVKGPTETQQLTPFLRSAGDGEFVGDPVAIAGYKDATVALNGINANTGHVRLAVTGFGAGVAKSAVLHRGETLTYKGVTLTFDDFDLSDFDPQAGKINIGAVLKVASGGKTSEITPFFHSGANGESHDDAEVPGLPGVKVRTGRMNPNEKTVEIQVLDPKAPPDEGVPMQFSVDLTIKPMIGLLWGGLVVLLAGGIMATIRRGEEFSTAAAGRPGAGA
ncbi:MAG: heme lyase CcmF/NrfE family subunit [Acidobacteria bacterium]|nr:MAG: heme lyase CcmF/NrfE family subunit [Acidobacteriota bacterium]